MVGSMTLEASDVRKVSLGIRTCGEKHSGVLTGPQLWHPDVVEGGPLHHVLEVAGVEWIPVLGNPGVP
jgi:hypothetical protein